MYNGPMKTIVNIALYALYIIFFCLAWDKVTLATNEFVEGVWYLSCMMIFHAFSSHVKRDLKWSI